ncbi:MAG: 4-oxalomesaconate tautomerase [Rhizobiales bacterium]|nr:4-oxalomesaconate tautomerase [Hyphomicrobiales bacterium]
MSQIAVPCVLMRGGTSKGPYFKLSDVPADRAELERFLLAVLGSPDERQIDGVGGADWLTSKAAMVGPSDRPDADLDYLFGQVIINEARVDFAPNCGNLTSGVGPFAIEAGMIEAGDPETRVRIFNINTNANIEAVIKTPGGKVTYDGDTAIDGVPGTAAPVELFFKDLVGTKTGKLMPTGNPIDLIEGVEVSCFDAAVPMIIARANDMGLTGYETPDEINERQNFFEKLECIRIAGSHMMGMGDPTGSVVPKFCIVSAARHGGAINARYMVPHTCHRTFPLVGGQCLAAACITDRTVLEGLAQVSDAHRQTLAIEHPVGRLETLIEFDGNRAHPNVKGIGFVRTARRLMEGRVFVPA